MKILMLSQVLPYPPDSGPKIKTWNVLKYLAPRHEVVLVSFVRGNQDQSVEAIRNMGLEVHTVPIHRTRLQDLRALLMSVVGRRPMLIERDFRPAMRDLVQDLGATHKFDIVHADQLNMAQYGCLIQGAKKVVDAHNALWVLYKRLSQTMRPGPMKWILQRDWKLMREYEGRICREYDDVIAVSQQDLLALREAAGEELDIAIIPITLDLDEYESIPSIDGPPHILHLGTMYWPPNVEGVLWFLREVWPRIKERDGEVVFDVVGARPPDSILAFAKSDGRVRVHGYVEDLTRYLETARAMIVPLAAGSGMRVKILDGLARGVPIVTTSVGAEGISVEHGKHLLVADEPDEFAQCVLRLLGNADQAMAMANRGRELVAEEYDYRNVLGLLDKVYAGGRGDSSRPNPE